MSVENSHHLLNRLREVDEYYAHQQPARGAEIRLLARLESRTPVAPQTITLSWNTVKRPLVILAACVMILATSLHDEIRQAGRIHFRPALPSIPAASTNPPLPRQKTRRELPRFHDTVAPMPYPNQDRSNAINQSLPIVPRVQSLRKNDIDSSMPKDAPRTSLPEFRHWQPLEKPNGTRFFETSPSQWYWPSATATKSESPSNFSGGSSQSKNAPDKHEETAAPPEAVVCQSPDVLKNAAYLDCSEQGLTLAEFTLLGPCEDGQFRGEKHDCAESETEIEACVTDTLGDGTTCEDPGLFKTLASETCTAAGQTLTDLVFDFNDCGGMAKMAKFTCCTPETPEVPPNPPSCHEMTPKTEPLVCRDMAPMKQEAWDMCNSEGSYFVDYKAWGDCPPGQASSMVVLCCDP